MKRFMRLGIVLLVLAVVWACAFDSKAHAGGFGFSFGNRGFNRNFNRGGFGFGFNRGFNGFNRFNRFNGFGVNYGFGAGSGCGFNSFGRAPVIVQDQFGNVFAY